MPAILAWINADSSKYPPKYTACWTSADTMDRPPATYAFPSEEHARLWVYYEAELLGCGVRWLNGQP